MQKKIVFLTAQAFCQGVGNLVPCGKILRYDLLVFDKLTQEVMADLDVLCTVMELRVPGDGDGGLVVDVEDGG